MEEKQFYQNILRKYSADLSQATYEKFYAVAQVEELQQQLQELTTIQSVLESDETLKALFYEQKQKLESGEMNG